MVIPDIQACFRQVVEYITNASPIDEHVPAGIKLVDKVATPHVGIQKAGVIVTRSVKNHGVTRQQCCRERGTGEIRLSLRWP